MNGPVGDAGEVELTVKDGWRVCLLFWKAAMDGASQKETVSRMKWRLWGCLIGGGDSNKLISKYVGE